jgi:hypothetical protein
MPDLITPEKPTAITYFFNIFIHTIVFNLLYYFLKIFSYYSLTLASLSCFTIRYPDIFIGFFWGVMLLGFITNSNIVWENSSILPYINEIFQSLINNYSLHLPIHNHIFHSFQQFPINFSFSRQWVKFLTK